MRKTVPTSGDKTTNLPIYDALHHCYKHRSHQRADSKLPLPSNLRELTRIAAVGQIEPPDWALDVDVEVGKNYDMIVVH